MDTFVSVIKQNIEKEGGVNKGCKRVAILLKNEWTWKHIYKVYRGWSKSSSRLRQQLRKLKPPKPTIKRYWTKIQADSQEQKDYWNSFPMEQRKEAMDNLGKDK